MGRRTIIKESTFHGYAIQQRPEGVIQQIMEGFEDRLNYMIHKTKENGNKAFSQISVAHFTITVPNDADGHNLSKVLGESITELKKG